MENKFTWYEVFDETSNGLRYPENDYWLDDYCESKGSMIGRYSTMEKAIARLKKWAEEKGIPFEENVHEEENPFSKSPIVHAGIYYSINDEPVKYTDHWAYASEAIIIERCMELDHDI